MKNVRALSLVALMVMSSASASSYLPSGRNVKNGAKGAFIAAGRVLTHEGITFLAGKAFDASMKEYKLNSMAKIATYVALETGSLLGFSKIRNLISDDSEVALYADGSLTLVGYALNWWTQENLLTMFAELGATKFWALLSSLWAAKVVTAEEEELVENEEPNATNRSVIDLTEDANVSDANVSDANVSDANVSDANVSDANVSDANVSDANVSDANVSDANVSDANVSDANVSDANVSDANVSDANVSDANVSDANVSDANVSDANVSDANVSDANVSDANVSDANVSDANVSGEITSDAIMAEVYK